MAVIPSKKEGATRGLILFVGFIIVFAIVLIFLFIIRTIYGNFSTTELVPDSNVLRTLLLSNEANIAVLHSDYSEKMKSDNDKLLNDNHTILEKFLNHRKNKFRTITDEDIESGNHLKYDLLILNGSISLSDIEIIEIKKYLDKGGSILASEGTASYSEDGKWRGWNFLSDVFGIKYTNHIGGQDEANIQVLKGGIPITSNIPTGYPLGVASRYAPIAVDILDPRTKQISYWSNYRYEKGFVSDEIKNAAAMVYGNYGEGRFIWMGSDISTIIGIHEDDVYFEILFNNSINWLLKKPIAFVKTWPSGYNAAAILSSSLNENSHNIKNLLPLLNEIDVKATFFVEPDFADDHKDLIKTVSNFGEIASLVDVGYPETANDSGYKLDDYNYQFAKLTHAKEVLSNIILKNITGFLPYNDITDNTMNALINAGYNYILIDSLRDRLIPRTIIKSEERILSIIKSTKDDYGAIGGFGTEQPEYQFNSYQKDIDRTLFEGGLFIFNMYTDYRSSKQKIRVVKDVISDLKQKKFWIATTEELQNWCRVKDYLKIKTEQIGNSRVSVTISNSGDEVASKIIIYIDLNNKADQISIDTEVIGTKRAAFSHQRGSEIINLYIDDLQPKESRTFIIDYNQSLS